MKVSSLPSYAGRTIVCIGTGPSLTLAQVEVARQKGFVLFGCNNVWQDVPDLELLYACNEGWWAHYWSDALLEYPASKWTTNKVAALKWNINWIAERNAPGLSSDPSIIHHGHGSGFTLLNLAYLCGPSRIVLLGYDLKYAPDYNGRSNDPGSTPRHYFKGGEYPSALQHWPVLNVKGGVHVELLNLYGQVAAQNPVEIINCSPGSALTCFPMKDIADV